MANTRIQIKRSTSTNATSLPALWTGEFAITTNASGGGAGNSNTLLYIGRPSDNAAIAVGGFYNFGVLTACQAVVVNSTSYVDQFKATNVSVNVILVPTQGNGTAGQVLTSNGTSNLYWSNPGGGGTVTQVFAGNGTATNPNPIVGTGNVYVVANSGIVANSTGTFANLAPTMAFISGAIYDPAASQLMFGGM